MKRKNVKKVFWFFIWFLPLQLAAVGIIGLLESEPYPALVQPSFQTVHDRQDIILLENVQFYLLPQNTINSQKIESSKLFAGVAKSQLGNFVDINFATPPNDELSDEVKSWLKKRVKKISPNQKVSALKVARQKKRYLFTGSKVKLDTVITVSSYIIPFKSAQ